MRWNGLASMGLFAALLNAQQTGQPKRQDSPKPQETCVIEGRVLSATGEPVKKASIFAFQTGGVQSERYTTATNAGGWFSLQDIEPGKYRMSAMKSGYAQTLYGARGPGHQGGTLSLDPGQHLSNVVLRLTPQAVITGRVMDEGGDPVPYVQMNLLRYSYSRGDGKRQLQQLGHAATNDLGEYRMFGLPPGRYYLRAQPQVDEELEEHTPGRQGYAPTYYPGTSGPAGATTIELRPGSLLRGIDVTLTKARMVRLRGRVILAGSGRGIQGAGISIVPRDDSQGMFMQNFNTDAQGIFQFNGLVPGDYFVQAQWSEDGKSYCARQAVDAQGNDAETIVVELSPATELKGQLRVEGRPVTSLTDFQVLLRPDARSEMFLAAASVKPDGSFTVSDIAPDHYRIQVSGASDDYYVKSARLGDKDELDTGLDFTHGAAGSLDIMLSSNGGQIDGVVLKAGEQPAVGAAVVLVPDERRRAQPRLYKDVTTDQYGRFTIRSITPGGYKLFAWEDVEIGAYRDPEFLKSYEALGTAMTIRENSHESAQLKLIPAEETKTPAAN